MLNIILALTLINGGGGGGGGGLPQVGDTLTVWVDEFNLILGRHPETAQVRGITDDAYILLPYAEVDIYSINSFHDYIIAGSEGSNFYTSDNGGEVWNGVSYVADYAKHVIIDSVLLGSATNVMTFVAGTDTIGYAVAFGGPATMVVNDTLGRVYDIALTFPNPTHNIMEGVMYAATEHGIAMINTHVAPPLWRFTFSIGGDESPTYAVYVSSDSVYAGRDNGLFVYDGSSWAQIAGVDGKVEKIEGCPSGILIGSDQGLYLYSGGSVQQILSGEITDFATVNGRIAVVQNDTLYIRESGGSDFVAQDIPVTVYSVGILEDEGEFLVGTNMGVYKYNNENGEWWNISDGIGSIISDSRATMYINAIQEAFNGIPNAMLNAIGIDPDTANLYDADGDPHVYIYITFLTKSSNISVRYIPAYFDPADEDTSAEDTISNKKEIIVINKGDFFDFDDQEAMERLLAYFYGRYVVWALDHDEDPWAAAGMASLAAYLATGLDMKVGIDGVCSFESNPNQYIFSYPTDWRPTPIVADKDRDRLFLFYEYLNERFGSDFINSLYTNEDNGFTPIQEKLRLEDIDFADFMNDWYFATYFDNPDPNFHDGKYGYENIDVNIQPSAFSPDGQLLTLQPYGSIFLQNEGTDVLPFLFNGEDDKNYRVYKMDSTGNITSITLDERNRARFDLQSGEVVMVYQPDAAIPKFYASSDTVAPSDTGFFVVQNGLIPHRIDAYFATTYLVYSDLLNPMPELWAIADQETTKYTMSLYTYHDIYIYNVDAALDVQGGEEKRFTLLMYYQDQSGNETISDTTELVVRRFMPQGGTLTLDNGGVVVSVPYNAFDYATTVMAVSNPKVNPVVDGRDGISRIYAIGNSNMVLNAPATIRVSVPNEVSGTPSLFRWENGTWTAVPTVYDPVNHEVRATVDRLGVFQVRSGASSLALNFALRNRIVRGDVVTVDYSLPKSEHVQIAVYDMTGRIVGQVYDGMLSAGKGSIHWNTHNVRSGVYFLKVKADDFNSVNKVVVIK